MSARNTLHNKKLRRLRKSLRRPLPRYIDIIQWLKDRGYANTTGEAKKLILDGRLRSESHKVGRVTIPNDLGEDVTYVVRHQPAFLRDTLMVIGE